MNKLYSLLQTGVSAIALCCLTGTVFAADVASEGELKSALQTGSDVTLTVDILLTGNLPEAAAGDFTIDGNSHTLSGKLVEAVDGEGEVPSVSGFVIGAGVNADFTDLNVKDLKQALVNNGTVGSIDHMIFANNVVETSGSDAKGGAIANSGTIGTISNSVFRENSAVAQDGNAFGGAIANTGGNELTLINTSFYDNFAQYMASVPEGEGGEEGSAYLAAGGAIYSNGNLNIVARGEDVVFSGNHVLIPSVEEGGEGGDTGGEGGDTGDGGGSGSGSGGGEGDTQITQLTPSIEKNGASLMGEEDEEGEEEEVVYDNISNAIAMEGGVLNLVTDGGRIIFDDAISNVNKDFDLNISGDDEVVFNNSVSGVKNFVLDNSFLTLGQAGNLSVQNYMVKGDSILTVTVNPDELTASQITVSGDVVGTTKVVVQVTSETVISSDRSILFVSSQDDDPNTKADFVVYRVYGSPYMWKITHVGSVLTGEGDETGGSGDDSSGGAGEDDGSSSDGADTTPGEGGATAPGDGGSGDGGEGSGDGSVNGWYLSMTDESNPDFRPMAPEIASFLALHSAAIEQNRGVMTSVRNSVGANKFLLKRYGFLYEDGYRTKAVSHLWANPVYRYVQVSAPQEWDATIAGFDMGLDLQSDASNKLGAFGSYRYGTYDVSEKGYFKANMGSEIEISSFLLGLYYRYDYNNFWTFATAYAGTQHAEIETDDHLKADADGMQYGAGFEMGYAFIPGQNWTLEPSLGIFYTGIDYDDMKDKYGKSAEYSMLNQIEGEFGIKLERTYEHVYGYSKVYVKPSIIQTVNFGNEVKITHLGKVDSLDDQTLGRIELGGRYALDGKMSLYGYVNYTTGSDYDDIAAGLGFNYRWY